MVMWTDKEYRLTKQIKAGKGKMADDFLPLAGWIYSAYGHRPLNIIYDKIDDKRPRIQVIFEFDAEKKKFTKNNGYGFGAAAQRAIAREFKKSIAVQSSAKKQFMRAFFAGEDKYNTEDIFVAFSSF